MMKNKLVVLIYGVILFLSGCGGLSADRHLSSLRDHLICEGKPPAYVDGYVAGCDTGRYLAGVKGSYYRKDAVRAENDALYARGWQDGQIACRNEAIVERQQQAIASGGSGNYISGNSDETRRRRMEEAEMQEIWDQLKK
jgi:hypothetical protein